MTKSLLLDVGNSSIACAEWDGRSLSSLPSLNSESIQTQIRIWETAYDLIYLSSVVPELTQQLSSDLKNCHVIRYDQILGMRLKNPYPEQIGIDRLMAALGAYEENSSSLVIDSGTALTFCYTNKEGFYEGGLIFPGMKIASQSLSDYTAKIPYIEVSPHSSLIGQSTKEAVQAGLYHGYIALINGIILHYKEMDPTLRIIGTGGGLDVLKDYLLIDSFDPDLVMKGIAHYAASQEK